MLSKSVLKKPNLPRGRDGKPRVSSIESKPGCLGKATRLFLGAAPGGTEMAVKDVVYTMRMNRRVKDALKAAAEKDRRSVASLLDKIVTDYLVREGFLKGPDFNADRRRFARKKVTIPMKTYLREGDTITAFPGVVIDISEGGALLAFHKGSGVKFTFEGEVPNFKICFEFPKAQEEVCFDCVAKHMRNLGHEIQVGANFTSPNERDLEALSRYLM